MVKGTGLKIVAPLLGNCIEVMPHAQDIEALAVNPPGTSSRTYAESPSGLVERVTYFNEENG